MKLGFFTKSSEAEAFLSIIGLNHIKVYTISQPQLDTSCLSSFPTTRMLYIHMVKSHSRVRITEPTLNLYKSLKCRFCLEAVFEGKHICTSSTVCSVVLGNSKIEDLKDITKVDCENNEDVFKDLNNCIVNTDLTNYNVCNKIVSSHRVLLKLVLYFHGAVSLNNEEDLLFYKGLRPRVKCSTDEK